MGFIGNSDNIFIVILDFSCSYFRLRVTFIVRFFHSIPKSSESAFLSLDSNFRGGYVC